MGSFAQALADLEARGEGRMIPTLDRITALAELLDHPEQTYPSIHITGTNGKTTTARLVTRILCAHGVSAGVTTSPHLDSVRERLALCDDPIAEEEFAETYDYLRPYLEEVDRLGEPVTYFEALAAMAYLWFADKPVEVGVFEVGMGGTWDATNLVRGDVAVICPIALDHPELGSTIAEVAGEKAGIIKEGRIAVLAEQSAEASEVLLARVRDMGAKAVREGQDFSLTARELAVGGQRFSIRCPNGEYEELFLPLHGEHQARHAAAAVTAVEALMGRDLSEEAVREALAGASSPGRLEVVSRDPVVILDGAHNPDAAVALSRAIGEAFVWQRLHLVIGVLETKDLDGMIGALAAQADTAYACVNSNPKSLPAQRVTESCDRAGVPAIACGSVADALDAARTAAGEDDLILVTGSLYTVADARPRFVGADAPIIP
jgi:dihydrofolate synthase/folylpolyglutamate synthase